MAAASFAYTGGAEMWYQDYLDAATGKMLIAEPGDGAELPTYAMIPVNPALPVPPSDGRWLAIPPAPPPPPAPQPVVSLPAPQGGVS